MTGRERPKHPEVVPGKARNATSAAAESANRPTNPLNNEGNLEGVGIVTGSNTEKTYGVVLKGGNPFASSSGLTGAATAKVDVPDGAPELRPDGTCMTMKPPKGAQYRRRLLNAQLS